MFAVPTRFDQYRGHPANSAEPIDKHPVSSRSRREPDFLALRPSGRRTVTINRMPSHTCGVRGNLCHLPDEPDERGRCLMSTTRIVRYVDDRYTHCGGSTYLLCMTN